VLAPERGCCHDCAMISERSGDPFVLPGENIKCDRAYSVGSDKSVNNADVICRARKKFIFLLIEKKKKN